ncbi:MAG: tRNA dihydrouridine(20/20a) synthase DusA [Gammaproteobacteria bacterium RIFCSPHIGHO2_12_FULL_38_14]|nr:MAG: tRNA dihydrouridine(20/20a) synthase DusA [Gammaproteobacteria bacterium RIFCSPHIGHO2_12_FULL_38_14]
MFLKNIENFTNQPSHPIIAVAPMMGYTDRHLRYLLRLIAPDIRLYTEMVTSQAILYGNQDHLLAFHPKEHPVALQIGGADPKLLAQCAKLGETLGYDEINLNVGCPSDRVQQGQFGACLMLKPELVADCVAAMSQVVDIPVTVKCRIGVDHQDTYQHLYHFVRCVSDAGCKTLIIHARKAWLSGLSPKQNREIPPLQYEIVRQIKHDFPHLKIMINGGIKTLTEVDEQLAFVDGVMIGRAACINPYFLAAIQSKYFPASPVLSRQEVISQFLPYIHEALRNKIKLISITRHLLGLFQGERGASAWRRYLSEHAHQKDANVEVIQEALSFVTL